MANFQRSQRVDAYSSARGSGVQLTDNQEGALLRRGKPFGSTAVQRAGLDPHYIPGYGASAAQNKPMGFSAPAAPTPLDTFKADTTVMARPAVTWDQNQQRQADRTAAVLAASTTAPPLPSISHNTPAGGALPIPSRGAEMRDVPSIRFDTPPGGALPASKAMGATVDALMTNRPAQVSYDAPMPGKLPVVQQTDFNQGPAPQTTRTILALPEGQSASATFVPGQNDPASQNYKPLASEGRIMDETGDRTAEFDERRKQAPRIAAY